MFLFDHKLAVGGHNDRIHPILQQALPCDNKNLQYNCRSHTVCENGVDIYLENDTKADFLLLFDSYEASVPVVSVIDFSPYIAPAVDKRRISPFLFHRCAVPLPPGGRYRVHCNHDTELVARVMITTAPCTYCQRRLAAGGRYRVHRNTEKGRRGRPFRTYNQSTVS